MTGSLITIHSHDKCPDCGRHLYQHDKKRVTYDGGRWGYDYECPEGSR